MRMACVAVVTSLPTVAYGQMVSPTQSDAAVVARGAIRFRGQLAWTRFDAIYGANGTRAFPLGNLLTTDLDVAALPLLAAARNAAATLTGSPTVALSLGRLRTSADSRIVSVPLSIEYGLTRRITIGATIPIVQSRTVVTTQLNGRADSTANFGTNPAGYHFSPTAYAANAGVASGLDNARDQLAQRIAVCSSAPFSVGCPAFNARSAEANALVAAATGFSGAVGTLYGISTDAPGAPFVPLANSTVQADINTRLASIRTQFTSFGINGGSGSLAAAQGVAANSQFQQIVSDVSYGIALDSIGSTEQTSVGDIELSVTSLLFNSFADAPTRWLQWRGTAAGVVRVGTGHPARANRPFDVPTGDGQTDLEIRGAVDMMVGRRLLTTVAATYTVQTGSVVTGRLAYPPGFIFGLDYPVSGSTKLGNMAAVRLNPRFLITPALMVGGLATVSHRAADMVTVTGLAASGETFGNPNALTVYSGGFTIAYSNLASTSGTGSARFPAEIHFSHLETLRASSAGAEKAFRDAIELRLYFRSRR